MATQEPAITPLQPAGRGGAALRVFRERNHMGLRETARRAGISPGYLSALETGKKPLHAPIVSRIADAIVEGLAR